MFLFNIYEVLSCCVKCPKAAYGDLDSSGHYSLQFKNQKSNLVVVGVCLAGAV